MSQMNGMDPLTSLHWQSSFARKGKMTAKPSFVAEES